jgi:hypothetical protein
MTISNGFFVWSELCAVWSIATYGVAADPLPEDRDGTGFQWLHWRRTLFPKLVGVVFFSYLITHSIIITSWLATLTTIHPWIRFRSPKRWTAELELIIALSNSLFILAFVRHLKPALPDYIPLPLSREHLSAVSIVGAILLFVVRGGTYIVRGCLRKAETLPRLTSSSTESRGVNTFENNSSEQISATVSPTSTPSLPEVQGGLDVVEINRGRLIGNLERLVLTLVVAGGSYAALGFLVAAKGLIRSEELQERDFAEYFLVGSLCSVLVALCAGLAVRFTLLALWPELLSFQMQGS